MKRFLIYVFLILLTSCNRSQSIECEIENLVSDKELSLGVAIYGIEDDLTISINGDKHFPMQSVYKFHIALAMLDQIDRGIFSLSDSISITQNQLLPATWSPFREQYPNGHTLPLSELIEFILVASDNNISDVIMQMVGGPQHVQHYIQSIGIDDVNIRNYESELKLDWHLQFNNFTTPNAAVELLQTFNNRDLLTAKTHDFIWNTMVKTKAGSIRDSLPVDIIIAHKTGYSGADIDGVVAANNDIGIMQLPNGKRFLFAIFITNSHEKSDENYRIISQIASIIYKHNK